MTTIDDDDPGEIAAPLEQDHIRGIPHTRPDEEAMAEAARRLGLNLDDVKDAALLLSHAVTSGETVEPQIIEAIKRANLAILEMADGSARNKEN